MQDKCLPGRDAYLGSIVVHFAQTIPCERKLNLLGCGCAGGPHEVVPVDM